MSGDVSGGAAYRAKTSNYVSGGEEGKAKNHKISRVLPQGVTECGDYEKDDSHDVENR
jgi:hypothetical protein